jgi:hypothetical protein
MIIPHLISTSRHIEYNGHAPEFIYDAYGYANYVLDQNTTWFIHIPVMQDRMTFDRINEKRYNIQVFMMALSEMEREAEFYHPIITAMIAERDKWLLLLDDVRDELNRKLITVLSTPEIITTYIQQSNAFDVPVTGISFNLPLLYNSYEPLC